MKNQWIQWADRNDLECAYLVVTWEHFYKRVINDEGDIESYQVSNDFIYILGKVPNEYFDKIIDRAWEKIASSFISNIEIKTESQICRNDKEKALRDYDRRNAESGYLTVLETVQYYQNQDYQIITYQNKVLDEISARTSTASQPNQEAQPNQERTDAAERTQPRAASSSNEKEQPKQTRAGADSSEQQTRKKAKEKDVQEAMELLRKRAETPNIKDWEKGTIILFLSSKGYNLELSKKTKIGKCWAIIYEQKTGAPPSHWYQSDIQKARDDLARDGIDFDWFL